MKAVAGSKVTVTDQVVTPGDSCSLQGIVEDLQAFVHVTLVMVIGDAGDIAVAEADEVFYDHARAGHVVDGDAVEVVGLRLLERDEGEAIGGEFHEAIVHFILAGAVILQHAGDFAAAQHGVDEFDFGGLVNDFDHDAEVVETGNLADTSEEVGGVGIDEDVFVGVHEGEAKRIAAAAHEGTGGGAGDVAEITGGLLDALAGGGTDLLRANVVHHEGDGSLRDTGAAGHFPGSNCNSFQVDVNQRNN